MKLLSIAVPCYQSEAYLRHCVDTLLGGGDEVEILIIDDGSTDATGDIADQLQSAYPGRIRVIHQKNGGHGAAVMTGLRHATGQYFKVVDSDDWLNAEALSRVLSCLRALADAPVDMVLCNYVYDKVGVRHKTVMQYRSVFPQDRVFTWDETGRFRPGQYILMHSVIYRTGLLRACGLDLPRHTFYVDNLYVYLPMRHVETMVYLDLDLYHYFIGREDQSINEQVMIQRIDQQIHVNKLMLEKVELQSIEPKRLRQYLCNHMEIVTVVSSILLYRDGTPESLEKKQALWAFIQQTAPWFYARLRGRTIMGGVLKHETLLWRKFALLAYQISQKTIGFN